MAPPDPFPPRVPDAAKDAAEDAAEDWAALVAGHGRAALLTLDGELLTLPAREAARQLQSMGPPLLVHGPATFRRLGIPPQPSLDLLELFAFALPATPVAPTPRGLALALDRAPPDGHEAAAALLPALADALLDRIARLVRGRSGPELVGLAARMTQAGWAWGPSVLAALRSGGAALPGPMSPMEAMKVWRRLPQWEETAPRPPPGALPILPEEARDRLARLLGSAAEHRAGQADYAHAAASAFAPRVQRGDPTVLLAEAGTGTGKTLGYVAPASLWAERNQGTVWISTYTRHLQRQVETELRRLHPDPRERRRRIVLRKGRENYLCLLNYEEAVNATTTQRSPPASLVPLGLVARWAMATADGDIQGGDLPGWFTELFGAAYTLGLADRRGECIHGACPHYQTCFVEHSIRRARHADLVVANHALVMAQVAHHNRFGDGADEDAIPTRYVFDEGHHLFEASDSAFAVELSGLEAAELRRWLLGAEGSRSRARGLRRRLDDLVAGRADLETPLDAALLAARALPAPGWSMRLSEDGAQPALAAEPGAANPTEMLLAALRRQVLARVPGARDGKRGQLSCDVHPVPDDVAEAATLLERALGRIAEPLTTLVGRLGERLDQEADEMEAAIRLRIEAACRTLRRRALAPLEAWQAMLRDLRADPPEPGVVPAHVMFLQLDRRDGQPAGERDIGLHRHWLDPTIPFAATLAAPAHGLLVTSATLRDDSGEADVETVWQAAEARVGASHLPSPALRAALASPFDYATQTRAFIVTDVAHDDVEQLAAAYRTLFQASGGGALGLFTAIARLRAVHARLAPALEEAGIPLFAQHIDAMDNSTLVDVFRTEIDSCLLGTDAMRDGVDVPGAALRLVAFERVPWPRPDILHRERRVHLSGGDPASFDDRVARLRLRQAFGRLIRRAEDRGVFVLLDRRMPSRLLSAFPRGVVVQRVGLAEAAAQAKAFLAGDGAPAELARLPGS